MLTDLAVRKAAPRDKPYKLSDGGGLYLLVTAAGQLSVVITFLAAATYPSRRFAELVLAMALLGGFIEVLQMIPQLGRDPDFGDWIADCGGSFVALLAWFTIRGVLAPARGRSGQRFSE